MNVERARYVKPGEMLAMSSTRLLQDRKGFFWLMGSGPLPNERKGDAVIVNVRGELEHHADADALSCAENYEGIIEKFRAAYAGESVDDAGEVTSDPPKAIILVLDSPGGVVSGLNECVAELQRMRAAHPEIPVSCYVNEMACSAAYALACSCAEIICPPSAIIGSIGVISTMYSQAAHDKEKGFDVRLLTSGARKADGHPHAPISDAAIEVETKRVEKLALAFFKLAGKARGLSVDKLRSFEAGIFLGKDAIRAGLADGSMPFGDLLAGAQANTSGPFAAGGNQTDRREKRMNSINALIKKTEAALAKETSPKKLLALAANLEAYKKTKKHVEHTETEEGADEEEEGGEEKADDEGGDEEAAKSESEEAAKSESEEKSAAFPKKKDDSDDDDDDDEDEAKSAKKALALVQSITGMKGKNALGALHAIAMTAANAAKDVAVLKREGAARDKANLIAGAKGKYLTTSEAKWLEGQDTKTVKGFIEHRKKAGVIVHTDDTTIVKPKDAKPGTEESLPQSTRDMIESAVSAAPAASREKLRTALVAAHLKDHTEQIAKALNGAAEGRY